MIHLETASALAEPVGRTAVLADAEPELLLPASPTLVLTVGLPRSGKSTWAKRQGCPIVNPDSIRLALHGRPFYAPAEAFVWATAHLMVESLFLAGHRTVILDATNLTEKRRREWKNSAWECRFVCFDTPEAVCIERAYSEGRYDLVSVIERMGKVGQRDPVDPVREGPLWEGGR